MTVYKLVNGQPVPFTSDPIYFEEYVQIVKGNNAKSGQPNEMWRTKFRSQMAKCARASILRATFPEAVGAEQTAEEMEGREIHTDYEPTVKDTRNLAQKIANERAGVADTTIKTDETIETVDADLLPEETVQQTTTNNAAVTIQDSLAAAEVLARDAGKHEVADALAQSAKNIAKATAQDTMRLVKTAAQYGWPTARVVDFIVQQYGLDSKSWSKDITKDQVDEVLAHIEQNPRK